MDEIRFPEIRPNGIESPASRPIRGIDPGSIGGAGRPGRDGSGQRAGILNASLVPLFRDGETYEGLRRRYLNGEDMTYQIASGC